MQNIEKFIQVWETRIAAHKEQVAQKMVQARVAALIDEINAGESEVDQAYYAKLVSQLAAILDRMQEEQSMSYSELAAEIEGIYGDQSKNETFYFNRKNASPSAQELAPLFAELPPNYTLPMPPKVLNIGDQSVNENLYLSRDKTASQKKR